MRTTRPMIAGAGATGLAAALFLARDDVQTRLIDSAASPVAHSRALALNPRTLEILETVGVTRRLLELGKPIRGVRVARGRQVLGEIDLAGVHPKYPFMLALSESATTRELEAALRDHGVTVERDAALIYCANNRDGVVTVVQRDELKQMAKCPWLLACDGAHSTVRQKLHIEFQGSQFDADWHLMDVPLATSLSEDLAHVIFLDGGGFLFLLRVVGEPQGGGDPVWRVMGNMPNLLEQADIGRATGEPIWTAAFPISHKIIQRLQDGRIYFAGDAAHVHSPVGARGMNLGIEDAYTFSVLRRSGRLGEYGETRHKVDEQVVHRIEFMSKLAKGETAGARLMRAAALPLLIKLPQFRNRVRALITGLDHPIELVAAA